jgi:hypothetical protein
MAPCARHVAIPQHARELFHPLLASHHRDIARGDAALLPFGYHEVLIGVHGNLR